MTAHDWFVEHRTSFVVRSLETEEESTFRVHLEGCEDCREAIHRIEQELAWLPLGGTPVTPRPELKRRLVESALGIRPRRSFAPLLAAAASLVLAVGAWAWATSRVRSAERAAERVRVSLSHQLEMARDTLEIMRSADRVRHASIRMGEQQGGMVIFADDRTHMWNVVVYGLPAPEPGKMCQFWFITETGMVRGVEVKTGEGTPAFLTLPMPPSGGPVMGAALTIEPMGSSSAQPEGKELAHLML
ncbi:MAG TPA: anti-sigma factor [Gemmatimonadales bacterium]|nr:anti-sigma factor [Gemmatimonadales bacterium]